MSSSKYKLNRKLNINSKKKKKKIKEFTQIIAQEKKEDLEYADHVVKIEETNKLEQLVVQNFPCALFEKRKNRETIIEEENY